MEAIVRVPNAVKLLSGSTSTGEPTFPWKLHMLLEESERMGFAHIISWQGDTTFKVHNQQKFESQVMKAYFKQSKYRSFQRQLNIYGFRRVKHGNNTGSYANPYFVRGKADICCFMNRTKIKKKGIRSEKTKTKLKFVKSVAFEKSNDSMDGTVVENDPETCLSVFTASSSNKHTVNSNTDSLSTCSSRTEPQNTLLDPTQTSLYVLPCDETKTIRTTIVDTDDNQNQSSSIPTLPLYQTMQQLRKMFQEKPQPFVHHLQQKVERGGLGIGIGIGRLSLDARKNNTAITTHDPLALASHNAILPCYCTTTDFELDLDTIFDDN